MEGNKKVPLRAEVKDKQVPDSNSIAVLPFINRSTSEENEYFSDGMTEEIINALSKIKNLKVTSRTSSFYFKNKNIPLGQIGQALNVSHILEGSVRLSRNKIRITAQLINVKSDFHYWSQTFDRSLEDIFAVQDEISLLIADKLREHMGHFEIGDRLVDSPNIPIETYKKFLKGKYLLQKRTLPDTQKALLIFEEIIETAPNFPLPYLAIRNGYTFLGIMGVMSAQEAFAKGKPYLEIAFELNPNLAEIQYTFAGIAWWEKWDLKSAYQHLNKALQIRPGYVEAYHFFAHILAIERKLEDALNYIDKAIEIDPFSATNFYIKGLIYYFMENYGAAIPNFEKSLTFDPNYLLSKVAMAFALLLNGQTDQAYTIFENLPADAVGKISKIGGKALVYATKGEVQKAEIGIAQLETAQQTESMGLAMSFLILCQTTLGRHDLVFQLIEQAIAYRLPHLLMVIQGPILNPLRSMPRFQAFIQQIIGVEHATDFSKNEQKKSALKKTEEEEYLNRLEQLISKEKPYLQPNLSLRQLAKMIDLHPNYLSRLLNEKIGKNFSQYINYYRVETFKQLAKDPKNKHLSILGLAFESGFNSKTVFNTYFKKEVGMTPNKYLKLEG